MSGVTTHGMSRTRTYRAWVDMRQRCLNPSNERFDDYGGRGITFTKQWDEFVCFFDDMGECPPGMSLDRKNNDGNYNKLNCRWATREDQQRNTRRVAAGAGITRVDYNGPNSPRFEVRIAIGSTAKKTYRRHHLGSFSTFEDAVAARRKAERDRDAGAW